MGQYDFIIDRIRFSYSSLNSFSGCKYGWKVNYIDKASPREPNFFSEYGTLIHDTLEEYFKGNLNFMELSPYFQEQFDKRVVTDPPPYPQGMKQRYYEAGVQFFNEFHIDEDEYDVLQVESRLDGLIRGIRFTGRPDLVLTDKSGVKYLVDYKTAKPFWTTKAGVERVDEEKIAGYLRQMYLYTYLLEEQEGISVDKIMIWFTRPSRKYIVDLNKDEQKKALDWVEETVKAIRDEEEFAANTDNEYFCNNLCDIRFICPYLAAKNASKNETTDFEQENSSYLTTE